MRTLRKEKASALADSEANAANSAGLEERLIHANKCRQELKELKAASTRSLRSLRLKA
jgi:hypothetical protein